MFLRYRRCQPHTVLYGHVYAVYTLYKNNNQEHPILLSSWTGGAWTSHLLLQSPQTSAPMVAPPHALDFNRHLFTVRLKIDIILYIYISVHVCESMHVCESEYVCIYECVHMCMNIYVYLCIIIYIYTRYMDAYMWIYIHRHVMLGDIHAPSDGIASKSRALSRRYLDGKSLFIFEYIR